MKPFEFFSLMPKGRIKFRKPGFEALSIGPVKGKLKGRVDISSRGLFNNTDKVLRFVVADPPKKSKKRKDDDLLFVDRPKAK